MGKRWPALTGALTIAACSAAAVVAPAEQADAGTDAAPQAIPTAVSDAAPAIDAGTDAAPPTLLLSTSGTRVAVKWAETTDGANIVLGYVDRNTGKECEPTLTSDGVWRCAPNATIDYITNQFYADNACSVPLAAGGGPGCDIDYVATRTTTPGALCGSVSFATARLLDADAGVYVTASPPSFPCQILDTDPPIEGPWYLANGVIPPTTWMAFHIETTPFDDHLNIRVFVGDDGSRLPFVNPVDPRNGTTCSFETASDGKIHCLPNAQYTVVGYSDLGCSAQVATPSFQVVEACAFLRGDPTIAAGLGVGLDASTAYAPLAERLYGPVGGPFSGNVMVMQDGGCLPSQAEPNDASVTVGPELSPTPYSEATLVLNGGTRIANVFAVGKYAGVLSAPPFDQELQAICEFNVMSDGMTRCTPTGANPLPLTGFAESTCKTRVGVSFTPNRYFSTFGDDGSDCAPITHVYDTSSKGTLAQPGTLWIGTPDDCRPTVVDPNARVFQMTSEVPPSTFAEATIVVR